MQHREQGFTVLLDFRTLMALARVLDRELVQVELLCHLVELRLRGLEQSHPDEAIGAMDVFADVGDRNVGELATVLVGNATDQHDRGRGKTWSAAIITTRCATAKATG